MYYKNWTEKGFYTGFGTSAAAAMWVALPQMPKDMILIVAIAATITTLLAIGLWFPKVSK